MKSFYDHHGFDEVDAYEMEFEAGMGDYPEGGATLRCNRCGDYNVRWRQQGGRWVLFSTTPGVVHTCPINTDGFAPVKE